jgi:Tol biopolymer transport system component/tRNA A-37 threonylcarbamoyl transferase component Bud32
MTDDKRPAQPPPEDWSELSSLVDLLLDTAPDRRAERIVELSGSDPLRRSRLEALLEEVEREPVLFSRSAADRFAALLDEPGEGFPEALAERYRLKEVLGRGAAATVYLAGDVKHGRDVAVKVVHPLVAATLGAERFLREIAIVAQLHHPTIVPLYDSGSASGHLYYVMPYQAGLSLRERLARDGPLSIAESMRILRDVCDALAFAHQRGIVHRDIKPGNILLAGSHALVSDFGVAKAAPDSFAGSMITDGGVVIGTPCYMAPEQIAADPAVDSRADLYALGVVAYEMLVGQPPFTSASRQEILAAQLGESPVPVRTRRPDVPAPLADLVMKCLEKRPADRWHSAGEVLERLNVLAIADRGPAPRRGLRPALRRTLAVVATMILISAGAALAWRLGSRPDTSWRYRWLNARIERLTDFPGDEVDAAISASGQFVAFLADREGVFDAFVTQVGSGQLVNLTAGKFPQLFNDDVRNVGFSAQAAHVWIRVADITAPASVALVPTLGGPVRPFLDTAVMAAWSPDGSRIAYHELATGDPIYVAERDGANPRRIFIDAPGVHCHHLSWSPDGRHLYFSRGVPPDDMDVWRLPLAGGQPERVTHHNSRVAYPVLVDDRTLFYTATDEDGSGPWLFSMGLDERVPQRLSSGVEHYLSISASSETPGQPRRLVATVSNPSAQLWTVPLTSGVSEEPSASRLTLPLTRSVAPRFAADSSLWYLASRGGGDALWRLTGDRASEIWKPGLGAVVGAPAVSPDGGRVCVPVRRNGRSQLHCTARDGSGARPLAGSLDVRGAPSWSPDGRWLAVAAAESNGIRIFKIPAGGGTPVRLTDSVSSNPVWSPDGTFLLYSGTPRGRSVTMAAIRPDGRPLPIPTVMLDRIGDGYRFLPDGKLVMKLGGFRRQDFWLFDITTGQRRQLTRLRPGESLLRFDVSPDGTRILFERVRENSDVALVELGAR